MVGYEAGNLVFNSRFARDPLAIVRCARAEDVGEAIGFVRRHDLETVARGGGHCFAGRSSTSGVVIDVTPMQAVAVDGDIATVGAGARLGPVYEVLGGHGLAIPAGTCPAVGVAGLTLGGGLGVLGRKHGLTSDHLIAAEVVLADGRIVTGDEEHHADLFWALRGAGAGNFGVVTSFTFRAVPAPRGINFHLAWAFADATEVVAAWQAWLPTVPDELYPSLKIVAPEDVDRPATVNLYGLYLGDERDAGLLLDELADRLDVEPIHSGIEELSFEQIRQFWAQLPTADDIDEAPDAGEAPQQLHFVSRSEFFRQPLPTEAIAQLLDRFAGTRVPGEARDLDFMPWGGAYNRMPSDATAFAHRDEQYLIEHVAALAPGAPDPAKEAAHRYVTESWESVHPWGSGRVYPNFPDPALENWADAYYGPNYPRLQRVKARYDPEAFFRFPQSISPA